MKNLLFRVCLTTCAALLFQFVPAQTKTNTDILKRSAAQQAEKEKIVNARLQILAKEKGWEMVMKRPNGGIAILTGIDEAGNPLYTGTDNNILAAATIGTNKLWPGGSTGLNLSGSSASVKNKLGVWDGGRVLATHVELTGRVVQRDNSPNHDDHATHVTGTLIARGINPLAKGMSYGQQELIAYDFNGHLSEMLNEASTLLVSNHSYGTISGWYYNQAQTRWEFRGPANANEDYKFGYYSSEAQVWDSIAYNAPYYLIVKSAGNNRNENGPAVGTTYWRYDVNNQMVNAGPRPAGISNNDSYDIISTYGTAKNILTVGAINPISSGYTRPEDAVISSFSSWGPTDDGRIKPDVVADGVNLLSSISTSDNAYAIYSGTSMAAPSASGSLLLLQEYYNQLHPGNFMRSATLKGLIIHTADEAGSDPGPDYRFGWGLINMQRAAAVITANNTTQLIQENVLNNGGTFSLPVIASGNGTISATLSWTDPKAPVVEPVATALNNTTPKLVNDLDIVIKKGTVTYRPWILNPTNRPAAATTGDNTLDNVEKIELPDVVPGDTYTIEITHKGTLARGTQAYSLIASGVGGQAYCASSPTSSAGAKIDSVSFGTIQNKNTAGCTTYGNFTSLTGSLQPGQTLPFFVRLNSCDATSAGKIVKVFIDANNDGDFTDANETLATSGVINGNGDFSTNITIPAGLDAGKYAILRIVMQETGTASDVTSCGNYARGETQDYRILFSTPTTDVGITELVAPNGTDCGSGSQYVTVRIANFGSQAKSNIPVTVIVTQGTTTIATLNGTYPGTLAGGSNTEYTLQTAVALTESATYTITSSTQLPGDQSPSNDQLTNTVSIRANSANPAGTAITCGPNTTLRATPSGTDVFTWYSTAAATTPIAWGSNANTTISANPYYLAKNDVSQHLGPINKMAFPTGSYLNLPETDQQLRSIFTTTGPLTIETARMYLAQAGVIRIRLAKINSFDYTTGAVNGYFVSDYFLNAYATSPTSHAPGTDVNDPADPGAIYRLGINVPEAGTWALIIGGTGTGSLYRNRNISTTNYPYSLPGIINMQGNGAFDGSNPNYYQTFYYFFYDIAIKLTGCPSARVPIVPTTPVAPVITINGNVLSSDAASGNQWLLNGNPINGATGQTHTATASGNYTVQVTDAGGCTMTSNQINYTITAVPNIDPAQIGLVVSPVPARGKFEMKLRTTTKDDLDISLINTTGQQVYRMTIPDFIGQLTRTIEPKVAAGVYYLRIVHDKKMYIRKIVMIE